MLTHADLSSLPASRELDALVAEKVMGTSLIFMDNTFIAEDGTKTFYEGNVPPYSTSIEAAWEVVEKFRFGIEGHVASCVDIHITDGDAPDISCAIYGPSLKRVEAWAPTAPLAICRAALRAVGASDA